MKKAILAACTVTAAAAFGGGYGITWQPVDGVYSGSWTNSLHWDSNDGTWPGQDTTFDSKVAVVNTRNWSANAATTNVVISFPQGAVVTNRSRMYVMHNGATKRFSLDGRSSRLLLGPGATGTSESIKLSLGTTDSEWMLFQSNQSSTIGTFADFSDFLVTMYFADGVKRLDFVGGTYNFKQSFVHFSRFNGTVDTLVEFRDGAAFTHSGSAHSLAVFPCAPVNSLRFRGGTHSMMRICIPRDGFIKLDARPNPKVNVEFLEGADAYVKWSMVHGIVSTDNKGRTTNLVTRVLVDASKLNIDTFGSTDDPNAIKDIGPGRYGLDVLNGGTFTCRAPIHLGTYACSTGRICVAASTATVKSRIYLGGETAEVAAQSFGSVAVTNSTLSSYGIVVRNGAIDLGEGGVLDFTASASTSALVCSPLVAASFLSDGGTVRMSGTTPAATGALAGFTDFAVASGGLTVEMAGADNFIDQDIEPASGVTDAEVRFKGPHATVVTGAVTVARVVVDGGRTAFATDVPTGDVVVTNDGQVAFCGQATAGSPLKSLDVEGGVLVLSPGETVAVSGDATLRSLAFALDGGFAAGDSASLVVGGSVDSASISAWKRAMVVSGLGDGLAWDVAVSSEGGATTLSLFVVAGATIDITVDSGTDVRSDDIEYSAARTLRTDVAEGAELRLEGDVGIGGLAKTGGGVTTLSSDGNEFVAGVTLMEGTLSALSPLALGLGPAAPLLLKGGTLSVGGVGSVAATPTVDGAVTISVAAGGDVTMPLPTAVSGTFFKRGAGRLTLETDGGGSFATFTNAVNGGVINACEGELVLRGMGAEPAVIPATGRHVYATTTPPSGDEAVGMTLDNVTINLGTSSGRFRFAQGITSWGASSDQPVLQITNESKVLCYTFQVGEGSSCATLNPSVALDNSTIDCAWEFRPNDSATSVGATNNWTLRNGAKVYSRESGIKGRFFCKGSPIVFDCSGEGTVIARNETGAPLRFALEGDWPKFSADMRFSDGAKFCCWYIGMSAWAPQTGKSNQPIKLTFDRGEWYVGGDGECVGSSNMNVTVTAKAGGLLLNPPENATWRAYVRIGGAGAIVKGGAGTLLMDRQFKHHAYQADTVTMAYAGRTEVLGGTMSIVSGAMSPTNTAFLVANGATLDLQGAAVSGLDVVVTNSAAISDAALMRATFRIAYDASTSSFARIALSDVSTSGRTTFDFGRGEGDPLPREFEGAQVGTWTGTKPDVSRWRGVNGGNAGIGYRFVATDDGRLLASSAPRGVLIYVR